MLLLIYETVRTPAGQTESTLMCCFCPGAPLGCSEEQAHEVFTALPVLKLGKPTHRLKCVPVFTLQAVELRVKVGEVSLVCCNFSLKRDGI